MGVSFGFVSGLPHRCGFLHEPIRFTTGRKGMRSESSEVVDEARDYLRGTLALWSVRQLADEIGIDASTLHAFVKDGGTKRPHPRTLDLILGFVRRAKQVVQESQDSEDTQDNPERFDNGIVLSPELHQQFDRGVHAPSYWQGEMSNALRTLGAMRKALDALSEMAAGTEAGVRGLVESGVLLQGGPPPAATAQGAPGRPARDMTQEEFFAEMQRRGYRPSGAPQPDRLPAAG